MKALSIQPYWATLIAGGDKTIEMRTWQTHYRGELLICASQSYSAGERGVLPGGHALAVADLVDVRPYQSPEDDAYSLVEDTLEFIGFAWVFENIRAIRPVPVKGRLHLFDADVVPDFIDVSGVDLLDWWAEHGFSSAKFS